MLLLSEIPHVSQAQGLIANAVIFKLGELAQESAEQCLVTERCFVAAR